MNSIFRDDVGEVNIVGYFNVDMAQGYEIGET